MPDTSFLAVPIRDHAFFEQAQFQGLLGDDLLQRPGFPAQLLDLAAGRRPLGIPRKASFSSLQELFRPSVIKALGNAFTPAKFCNAVLAAQTVQHDADLLLRRILLARCSANVLHDPPGGRFGGSGFLAHLHSSMVTMSQKSSVLQTATAVSQALTSDIPWPCRARG